MANAAPRWVHVEPDSERGRVLDEAGETPVLLEKNGKRCRVRLARPYTAARRSAALPSQRPV